MVFSTKRFLKGVSKSRTLFLPVNITVFPFDFPQSSMKCTTSPYLNDGCPVNTTQGVLKQLLNPSAKITLYETGDVQRHSHPNIMTRLRATNGLCIDQFEALTRPLPPPPPVTHGRRGKYSVITQRTVQYWVGQLNAM